MISGPNNKKIILYTTLFQTEYLKLIIEITYFILIMYLFTQI